MKKALFSPASVTGIGSLPYTDPQQAISCLAEVCPSFPFWPQLPQRGIEETMVAQAVAPLGDMIEQQANGYSYQVVQEDVLLSRLHNGKAGLSPSNAAGFFAFEAALAHGIFNDAIALKGQIVGPLTLASHIFLGSTSLLEHQHWMQPLAAYIARLALWQVKRLQQWNKPVVLFLDEPCLTMVGLPDTHTMLPPSLSILARVVETIRAAGAFVGIHSCATPERAVHAAAMSLARPDILSFDAHNGIEAFFADPEACRFINNGGTVAFGIVPTWDNLSSVNPQHLFTRWKTASEAYFSPALLANATMITASCGLGLLNDAAVRDSFEMAHCVAELIQQLVEET
jgi:hypothetical protein